MCQLAGALFKLPHPLLLLFLLLLLLLLLLPPSSSSSAGPSLTGASACPAHTTESNHPGTRHCSTSCSYEYGKSSLYCIWLLGNSTGVVSVEGEAWYSAGRLAEVHGASTQWEHSRRGAEVRDGLPKGRHQTATILLRRTSYKVAAAVVKTCPRLVYSKASIDTPHTHFPHTVTLTPLTLSNSLPSHCHLLPLVLP